MIYTKQDVFDYIEEEDVKFIRLAFCDYYGKQKNISIMPEQLEHAFEEGISFDPAAIDGFRNTSDANLLLFPVPETINILPWRPHRGKVVRMFCDIKYPNGEMYEYDSRNLLTQAVKTARNEGIEVLFGSEIEFYLFKTDEEGNPTKEPFDHAGYMDVAPEDKGEDVRREICLNLMDMDMHPESSQHKAGPGQNEINFKYDTALKAADDTMNFKSVVRAVAMQNGLFADFSPKPLPNESGNGMHINISVESKDGEDKTIAFMAGILEHIKEITAFLNPRSSSYKRLGERKAPKYITWSEENQSYLIRVSASKSGQKKMELRSADPSANPYLAYAMLIYAGLDGIKRNLTPQSPLNKPWHEMTDAEIAALDTLPDSIQKAQEYADNSKWLKEILPDNFLDN